MRTAFVILASVSSLLFCTAATPEKSVKLESPPQDGLGSLLVLTVDDAAARKAILADMPVQVTNVATRGQLVTGLFVISGCKTDTKGWCHVSADIDFTVPVGALAWPGHKGLSIIDGSPPMVNEQWQVAETTLGIKLDPADTAGTYIIRSTVTDLVAGTRITGKTVLELTE